MGNNHVAVHIHFVWSTWSRRPLIDAETRSKIHKAILGEAHRFSVNILAIGGVSDHMHVLASLPPTITLSQLAKQFKGASSLECGTSFRWQRGYSALSVSRCHITKVIAYIQDQEGHHKADRLIASLEKTD